MKCAALGPCLALLLSACAPVTQVILLPHDGEASALRVSTAGASRTLSIPYTEANVSAGGSIYTQETSADEVASRYRELLSAQPVHAKSVTLYFAPGSDELTPQSQADLGDALTQAKERPQAEISVTLYSEEAATRKAHDRLTLRRVRFIQRIITAHGFDPSRVRIVDASPRSAGTPASGATRSRAEMTVQ